MQSAAITCDEAIVDHPGSRGGFATNRSLIFTIGFGAPPQQPMRLEHLLLLLLLLLSSCGNQRSFSGDARFAKRHYQKGWHLDLAGRKEAARSSSAHRVALRRTVVDTDAVPDPAPLLFAGTVDRQALSHPAEPLAERSGPVQTRHDPLVSNRTAVAPQIRAPQPVQDVSDQPRKWNWFALVSPVILIAALAVAIPAESTELLLLGCLVAVAIGYVGARQCRDREDRGAGFAMITLGLASAGVFIALLALLLRL